MAVNTNVVKHSPILWIEGRWPGSQDFVPLLRKKGFVIEVVSTGKQAIEKAADDAYDLMVINAASMRTSGARISKNVRGQFKDLPIILVCSEDRVPTGVDTYVDHLLVMDFTTRKLVNRIMKLLPGDHKRMIHKGPLVVDPDRSLVISNGQKTTLTPKLYYLLKMFLDKPGEVIAREELFMDVWKTSYTGDTRTLDVHISWLRQAIEVDPRNPKLLTTVRGVGYKLDV